MKIQSINRNGEKGFWSAFFFIFLVTLGLMGLGAYSLMRGEGSSAGNQVRMMQADFALDAGTFFALRALSKGTFNSQFESEPLSVGEAQVQLDTSRVAGFSGVVLTVTSTLEKAEKQLIIRVLPGQGLRDKAIVTTGTVSGVVALDSLRVEDPLRLISRADSIPTIKEDSLEMMSTMQGHDKFVATYKPPNGYPNGSFWQADGVTPNVTHVFGNLDLAGNEDFYGIFIVEGNVTLKGTTRFHGVLYLPNVKSTIIKGGGTPAGSTIEGAIVSHGDISGNGSHITVEHDPTFMNVFCRFQKYPDNLQNTIVLWCYT
jgi:hypothetical protein